MTEGLWWYGSSGRHKGVRGRVPSGSPAVMVASMVTSGGEGVRQTAGSSLALSVKADPGHLVPDGRPPHVAAVAFSPDGRWLAAFDTSTLSEVSLFWIRVRGMGGEVG